MRAEILSRLPTHMPPPVIGGDSVCYTVTTVNGMVSRYSLKTGSGIQQLLQVPSVIMAPFSGSIPMILIDPVSAFLHHAHLTCFGQMDMKGKVCISFLRKNSLLSNLP